MIVTLNMSSVYLYAQILLIVRIAQTIKESALTTVENEAFDPGYGLNIGVKSEGQQNKTPLRTILHSKTYQVSWC